MTAPTALVARCPHGCFMALWESIDPKPNDSCPFCDGAIRLALERWEDGQWSGDNEIN